MHVRLLVGTPHRWGSTKTQLLQRECSQTRRVRLAHTLRGEPNPQQCFTIICLLISVHLEGLFPRCTDRKQPQDGGNLALKAGPPRWGLPVPRPGTSWTLLGSSSAETGTRCVKPPPIRSGWSLPREVTQGDNSDRLWLLSYGIDQDSGKSKVTFLRSFQPQGTWSTKRKTPAQRVKMSFPLISNEGKARGQPVSLLQRDAPHLLGPCFSSRPLPGPQAAQPSAEWQKAGQGELPPEHGATVGRPARPGRPPREPHGPCTHEG